MKKRFLILTFVFALALIMQSCNFPFQSVGGEEPPPEEFSPEEPPPDEHPPEEGGEAQILYFEVHRETIQPGECVGIEWGVHGSPWVFFNENPVEPTGMQEVCPPETTSYRLSVDAGEQMLEREVTIFVEGEGEPQPPPQPNQPAQPGAQPTSQSQSQPQSGCNGSPIISSFTANPSTITAGQSATLTWGGVTNGSGGSLVKSVVLEPGFGEVGSPGSRAVKPQKTTTYTLKGTGCGGTAQKQVTVIVNSGPTAPAAPSGVDLAITDLYPDSQPKGGVYARITNNGPGSLSNAKADLKCTLVATNYNTGVKNTVAKAYPVSLTLSLTPGQTKAYDTHLLIDTSNEWYAVDCTVQVQNSNDSKPNNNSYSETIPPPP